MIQVLDKLSSFYGVNQGDLIKAYSPCYLLRLKDFYTYGFLVENVTDGKKIFVFAYDSYMMDHHLKRILEIPFVSIKSPALDIDVSNLTLDELVNRIKTKKSLLVGEKSKDIIVNHRSLDINEMYSILKKVQENHPNVTDGPEKYFLQNGYQANITEGFVKDENLFKLIWFSNGKDLCGTNIISTENEVLRKQYSPSVFGHFSVIKNAIETKHEKCRFSLYFNYKKIFGFPPTMYPSIDFYKLQELISQGVVVRFKEMELDDVIL